MLKMTDSETGLTVTLDVQSKPKNPRLVENNMFQLVTWPRGLGDAHEWHNCRHLLSSIDTDTHTIFKLKKEPGHNGAYLVKIPDCDSDPDGFAVISHELLKIEFATDEITPAIIEKAEDACLVELLKLEEYVCGQVFFFQIVDRTGVVLEEQGELYGQDYAEHIAKTDFDRHRMSVIADG